MLSFSEAANSGAYVTLTDKAGVEKVYRVGAIGPEDLALAKERVRTRTEDPLEIAKRSLGGLPPEDRKVLLERGFDEHLKWGDLQSGVGRAWVASEEGIAFFIYRAAFKYDETADELWIRTCVLHMAMSGLENQLKSASQTLNRVSNPPAKASSRKNQKRPARKKR